MKFQVFWDVTPYRLGTGVSKTRDAFTVRAKQTSKISVPHLPVESRFCRKVTETGEKILTDGRTSGRPEYRAVVASATYKAVRTGSADAEQIYGAQQALGNSRRAAM